MNILDKITERDALFDIATAEVFELFPKEFVKGFGTFINSVDIEWKSICLHPVIKECILLEGIATIDIGSDVILNDGTPITITDENQQNYRQLVGFIFPIILIEYGTADDVVEYMKDIVEVKNSFETDDFDIKDLIANYLNTIPIGNEKNNSVLVEELKKQRTNKVKSPMEFDVSTLTEVQKASLNVHTKNKRVH